MDNPVEKMFTAVVKGTFTLNQEVSATSQEEANEKFLKGEGEILTATESAVSDVSNVEAVEDAA